MNLTLFALNAIVATLNVRAYAATREARDLWATVAWVGSASYWLFRAIA